MPGNKNYIRGRAWEYEVMKKLESSGFTVYRMAGSHGQFDLIGFTEKYVMLVQCKTKLVDGKPEAVKVVKEEPTFKHAYPLISERWTKFIRRRK